MSNNRRCCCRTHRRENVTNFNFEDIQAQLQAQQQEQDQRQRQRQEQDQDNDQDQDLKTILKNIGNGNNHTYIKNDYDGLALAILVAAGSLLGTVDGDTLRTYIDRLAK